MNILNKKKNDFLRPTIFKVLRKLTRNSVTNCELKFAALLCGPPF